MDYAYYNGWCGLKSEARVSLSDRSVFFGDGVYDCMIGKNGIVYQEHEHIARLRRCSAELFLELNLSDECISNIIKRLITLSEYKTFIVYISVSRNAEIRRHYVPRFGRSNLLITVTEHQLPAKDALISLKSCDDIRYRMCNIKTLNLLPSVLAAKAAEEEGYDEAVFLRSGIVTECSHSNIAILKNGVLITHPNGKYILPGITRENLIKIAKKSGITVLEQCFGYNELITADEVLVTATTSFIRRAEKVDNNIISCSSEGIAEAICSAARSDYDEYCC